MRAFLVNPWIYDFAAYDLWSKPLGLLTIAARLIGGGARVSLLDCLDRFHPALPPAKALPPNNEHRNGSGQYLSEEIAKPAAFSGLPRRYKRYGLPVNTVTDLIQKEERPDVILVTSGMTYWYPAVHDMIALLKNAFPGIPIILGGNYPNLSYDHAQALSGADLVFRGMDIDRAMSMIEKAAGAPLGKNGSADPADSFPAYDLYRDLPYVTLKTSHGCPFRCTYCGWHLIDEGFSRQDPSSVVAQIDHFYRTRGVRNFAFYDDALLYKTETHFMRITDGIMERGIRAHFLTPNGLHNRFLSLPVARAMKSAGFVHPRLALETISAVRQSQTGDKTTTADCLAAVDNLLTAGYKRPEVGVNILIGLPGQEPDEIEATIRLAASHGLRMHLEEYSPIPGTPEYKKTGLAPDADPLLHNNSAFPLFDPEGYRAIQRLKKLAHDLMSAERTPLPGRPCSYPLP